MSLVEINLFGPFRIHCDGQDVTEGTTDKARALLTYLALEGEQPRTRLTALLWPYLTQESAFDNLRKTLYRLRQRLGVDLLIAKRQSVQLDYPRVAVDLLRFQSLLKESDLHLQSHPQSHHHGSLITCDECVARLGEAVELYQGELLAGFGLSDAPAFEEWLLLRRQSLQKQALLSLGELIDAWEVRGDLSRAYVYKSRTVTIDPLREEGQGQQMHLLRQMSTVQKSSALPFTSARQILNDVPHSGHVYGRRHEVERLTHWITQAHARLVTIVGMGGIGKTTLAAATANAVVGHFEVVLWRSVINAPPLWEILQDWLAIFSENTLAPLPESLDAQLAMLVEHLRARRCLLILDNLESIFQPDQAGQMRPEHRGYTQLLHRMAETHHQSCLLLTSRELPQGIARLQEDLPWVHSIALDGLDMKAAQALLSDRGLTGERSATLSLVERYSGNPLALKLVAETAQGLFNGDIAAFLMADTLIFDDIRAVLDWQFNRLPPLEQELLLWLAVEREPVSIQTLRDNLFPPRPLSELLVAIRGLQRRSLLERTEARDVVGRAQPESSQSVATFTLQNVLMEYLIDRLVEAATQEIEQETPLRLHRHALMKANAKEYVRQSQVRLILQPIGNRLLASFSKGEIGSKISRLLTKLRGEAAINVGYAPGCLLNLLLHLEIDLTGYDFSHLPIWQADLRRAQLPHVDLSAADLAHTYFVDSFGCIFDTVYSPDGACIAAATDGGTVRVWQAADGRLLRSYAGHVGPVRSVAFSPDGTLIASCGEDGTVRLWNFGPPAAQMQGSQSPVHWPILRGHTGRVTRVLFHPDGKRLASAGVDKEVRLWDLATAETIAILKGHEGWVWSLAFDATGETLASAGLDHLICLWDVESATLRATLSGHSGAVSAVAYDPQGRWLASGSFDRTVRLWDVESGETLQRLEASLDAIWSLAFSHDGETLATSGDDRVTRLWPLQRGAPADAATLPIDTHATPQVLHGHRDVIFGLAFSPDGKTLVTGAADQSLHVWDLPTIRLRQMIVGPNQGVPTVTFHPNGKVLVSASYNGAVHFWDLEQRRIRHSLTNYERVIGVVTMSSDGAWLANGGDDLELWRIDGEVRAQLHRRLYHLRGRLYALCFSPNGRLVAGGGVDQTAFLWDVQSGSLQHKLESFESPLYCLRFSPDGSLLAAGTLDQISLWDPHSARLYHQWNAHTNVVWALVFTADGKRMVSAGGDGVISLWDISDPSQPQLQRSLRGHSDRVYTLAISADGQRLYSGSADHTIRVWDLSSHDSQPIQILKGHTHWVWTLDLSPDGKCLASSTPDGSIRLWDSASGECLDILVAPGPYAGMKLHATRGITEAEKATLKMLGAVEE